MLANSRRQRLQNVDFDTRGSVCVCVCFKKLNEYTKTHKKKKKEESLNSKEDGQVPLMLLTGNTTEVPNGEKNASPHNLGCRLSRTKQRT